MAPSATFRALTILTVVILLGCKDDICIAPGSDDDTSAIFHSAWRDRYGHPSPEDCYISLISNHTMWGNSDPFIEVIGLIKDDMGRGVHVDSFTIGMEIIEKDPDAEGLHSVHFGFDPGVPSSRGMALFGRDLSCFIPQQQDFPGLDVELYVPKLIEFTYDISGSFLTINWNNDPAYQSVIYIWIESYDKLYTGANLDKTSEVVETQDDGEYRVDLSPYRQHPVRPYMQLTIARGVNVKFPLKANSDYHLLIEAISFYVSHDIRIID